MKHSCWVQSKSSPRRVSVGFKAPTAANADSVNIIKQMFFLLENEFEGRGALRTLETGPILDVLWR